MFHPCLWFLWAAYVNYGAQNNLPTRMTSFINDRENVKSVSNSHIDGRAFDGAIQGWSKFHANRFVFHINEKFKDIAAISQTTGKPIAAVYGDEKHRDHIHFQVRPDACFGDLDKL